MKINNIMNWRIKYKIVGDPNVKEEIKDLHFTQKHQVIRWFKLNKNPYGNGGRNIEIVSVSPISSTDGVPIFSGIFPKNLNK